MTGIDHIAATTWHGRVGDTRNAFTYSIDYVLTDAEAPVTGPAGFGRNRAGLMSLQDSDHGGPPKAGRGAAWVREVLAGRGLPAPDRIELLAQPRVLGHVFNPVSFWLCRDAAGVLRVVIAEVSNTFGDRHSYLCHRDDLGPIDWSQELVASKVFHVSPFQPIAGGYRFRFEITEAAIRVRIAFGHGSGEGAGLVATLAGDRRPLTTGAILRAMLRRPFGSRRVLGLIHWQALKLWWKGVRYRPRPQPPAEEVSR